MTALLRATLCGALAALCACGDSSGADAAVDATVDATTPAPDAAPDAAPSCGEFGSNAACAECLASECCAEGAACAESDACTMLAACTRDCAAGDADCLSTCVGAHAAGRGPYNVLVLCMGERCLDACPFPTP